MGAAAPTLAGPGWVEEAVRSEQPPHPRRAGAALGASPAAAPAHPVRRPTPGSARSAHRRLSCAHSPGSPAAPRGPLCPRSPGAAGQLSAALPAPPPSFGTRGLCRGREGGGRGEEEAGAAAAGAERKWHARALEAEVLEDGGRRCRGSVGEEGESERGERGARAPAGCGEARAALRLRPPHPGAPTLRATGPGSGSRLRRRRHHPEERAKVWIWGRTRR